MGVYTKQWESTRRTQAWLQMIKHGESKRPSARINFGSRSPLPDKGNAFPGAHHIQTFGRTRTQGRWPIFGASGRGAPRKSCVNHRLLYMVKSKTIGSVAVMECKICNIGRLLQKNVRKWHLRVERRSKQLVEACRYEYLRHPGLHHDKEYIALKAPDIRVATAGKRLQQRPAYFYSGSRIRVRTSPLQRWRVTVPARIVQAPDRRAAACFHSSGCCTASCLKPATSLPGLSRNRYWILTWHLPRLPYSLFCRYKLGKSCNANFEPLGSPQLLKFPQSTRFTYIAVKCRPSWQCTAPLLLD